MEQERGEMVFVLEDKGLPLHREEIYMAHNKMTVYRGKMGKSVLR